MSCGDCLRPGDEVHAVDCVAPDTGGIDPARRLAACSIRATIGTSTSTARTAATGSSACADTDFDYAFHLAAMVGGRLMIENNPLAVADDLAIDAAYWQWAKLAQAAQDRLLQLQRRVPDQAAARRPLRPAERGHDRLRRRHRHARHDLWLGEADLRVPGATGLREARAEVDLLPALLRLWRRPGRRLSVPQHLQARASSNRGRQVLNVWGTGTQMRDFIHIDDCVDGILATMDQIDDADAVNLSTGIFTSFIEFAQTGGRTVLGYQPEVQGLVRQAGRRVRARRRHDAAKAAWLSRTRSIFARASSGP